MNYIFGPVPSRRLGRSLGVDLVPFKTCTYDCIYCQLARTTHKTIERKEWVPLADVLEELRGKLASQPDYVTLSGSGEPTLFSRTGELIDRIKAMTDIPIAVLTNGSLLWQSEVRDQLRNADLVIPSLDAGDETMFQAVNRPHEGISFERMLNGLIEFRREFQGQYWLEVMFLAGHNAVHVEAKRLARCVSLIKPDRVELNTATRPCAEDYAFAVQRSRLSELADMFDPTAEVIADFRGACRDLAFTTARKEVLELLRRRPCSLDDMADGLGMHRNEVVKYVEELTARKLLDRRHADGKSYYSVTRQVEPHTAGEC